MANIGMAYVAFVLLCFVLFMFYFIFVCFVLFRFVLFVFVSFRTFFINQAKKFGSLKNFSKICDTANMWMVNVYVHGGYMV